MVVFSENARIKVRKDSVNRAFYHDISIAFRLENKGYN